MKVFAFKPLLFLALPVFIQACGPGADEIRNKQLQEQQAAQQKVQEEIMVHEAMELIKSQSLAIARGENVAYPETIAAAVESEPKISADTPHTTTTSAGAYTIQVANLNTREIAEEELRIWRDRGFSDAFITQHKSGFRVRLGRYSTDRDAQSQRQKVNSDYNISAWVSRIQAEDTPSGSSAEPVSGNFSVQVAAVNSRSAANREINTWKERGFPQAFAQEVQRNESTLYRIRLGRFETRTEAVNASNTVNERYNIEALIYEF